MLKAIIRMDHGECFVLVKLAVESDFDVIGCPNGWYKKENVIMRA
jgi:hypothetical protein